MKMLHLLTFVGSLLFLVSHSAMANDVEIITVQAHQKTDKTWIFAVTLKHSDTGWEHYANEWKVITKENNVLATRTLYHPHVNEQPFTRNISGVKVPHAVKFIRVIAKDSVHGYASTGMRVNLETGESSRIMLTKEDVDAWTKM